MPVSRRTRAEHDKPISNVQNLFMGSFLNRNMVVSWQIWFLSQSQYKLEIFQMSITSSEISFGTQFKEHILANRAAHHLRLKKFENNKNQKKSRSECAAWYSMYQCHDPSTCINRAASPRDQWIMPWWHGSCHWWKSVHDRFPSIPLPVPIFTINEFLMFSLKSNWSSDPRGLI
jgi:hypothetical protein